MLQLSLPDSIPAISRQEVALNFARQHGGIAANELPDIVNFISQARQKKLGGTIGDEDMAMDQYLSSYHF